MMTDLDSLRAAEITFTEISPPRNDGREVSMTFWTSRRGRETLFLARAEAHMWELVITSIGGEVVWK